MAQDALTLWDDTITTSNRAAQKEHCKARRTKRKSSGSEAQVTVEEAATEQLHPPKRVKLPSSPHTSTAALSAEQATSPPRRLAIVGWHDLVSVLRPVLRASR